MGKDRTKVNIEYRPTGSLIMYANNPRRNDDAVDAVAASIKEFGFKVPIVIDSEGVIVAGHTRLKAAKKLRMEEVPCIVASDLTPAQIKAFRLADNRVSELSEWDEEMLQLEMDDLEMDEIDMTEFGFEAPEDEGESKYDGTGNQGSLADDFIIPPFSVLDARQGYWQQRKRAWKALGLKSDVGRADGLLGQGLNDLAKATGMDLTGTSIFDPVLCEILYQWFNVQGGKIFDPFAGGSVRGIVAAYTGFEYTGIDLRQEQVDANVQNAAELGLSPTWYCDDSLNADRYVQDASVDMILSCPPYADLEQYSDDPRDISTMEYEDFLKVYGQIIAIAVRKLKNDRFAAWVVGDVRDKNGMYRDFVSDTIRLFREAGMSLYNEFILVEQLATAALRARRQFNNGRKCTKCHQNVLVFFKGDPKTIKSAYTEVIPADLPGMEEGDGGEEAS